MLNILIKYIANEPMAAVGFGGIYIFGSIEIALRFWSAFGHPNIAVFFLSTVIVFTKIYFKRLLLIIRKAKKD
ncbi:hypothetical protein L3081_24630 [Colwellia sp. MSW7]|uniref:Uncharacterized protein n=1 Tax=Colwellia maritima TaxID=2912588 RepID=A0ABS9X6Z9_9GAMM|nr:hypothetical protein [Colwellia maritima]MCI2286013.1 hypothetical protein [Colwellia maritima]